MRLADLFGVLWDALVVPSWRQIRDCLERDISYRSHALAAGGLAAVFEDMSPSVSLEADASSFTWTRPARVRSRAVGSCSYHQRSSSRE